MSDQSYNHNDLLFTSDHHRQPRSIQTSSTSSHAGSNQSHHASNSLPSSTSMTPSSTIAIALIAPQSYGTINAQSELPIAHHPLTDQHDSMDSLYRNSFKLPNAVTSQNALSNNANEHSIPLHRTLSEVVADSLAGGAVSVRGLSREEGRGTFKGVVVPTLEFMWSVIIFVRFGYIAGQAGLIWSLGLLYLSAAVSAVTLASISAIATNGVPRGGVLSVLEKSLGKPVGGSITLLYFIAVATFISVEVVGSVQGVLQATVTSLLVNSNYWDQVLLSLLCVLGIVAVVVCGDRVYQPLSLVFMLALAVSFFSVLVGLVTADFPQEHEDLKSLVTGFSMATLRENLHPSSTFIAKDILSFVFPCYIGIYTGVNRASQLKNPFKSIPEGGFISLITSTILYTSLMLLIAANIKRKALENTMILAEIAFPRREVAIAGIGLVGIGSALQCLIISSTVLATLAKMQILPNVMESLHLEQRIKAIFATACIALPLVFVTELELLAIIVTNCFLLCYGASNFAALLLSAFKAPSWRPVFEYHHWTISFIGCVLCFGLMLYTNLGVTIFVLLICVVLGYVIFVSSEKVSFGEGLRSLLFHIALSHLVVGESEEYHENVQQLNLFSFQSSHSVKLEEPNSPSAPQESHLSAPKLDMHQSGRVWRAKLLAYIEKGPAGLGVQHPRLLSFISQLKSNSGLAMLIAITTAEEVDRAAFAQGAPVSTGHTGTKLSSDTALSLLSASTTATWKVRQGWIDYTLLFRRVQLQRAMNEEGLQGFSKSVYAASMQEAQCIVMDSLGLGELTANTVVTTLPAHYHNHHNHYDASSTNSTKIHYRESALSSLPSIASSSASTAMSSAGNENRHADNACYNFQYLMDLTASHGNTFVVAKGIDCFPSNRQRIYGSIDIWWTTQDQSGQMIPLLIGYILQQNRVWSNCAMRIFVASHATEDKAILEKTIRLNLTLMRIGVEFLEIVPLPYTTHQKLPPTGPELDDVTIADAFSTVVDDGQNDDELYPETPSSAFAFSSRFAKTWGKDIQSCLSPDEKRDLFLRAIITSSLKHEMESRSSRTETALVIMNVPGVDEKGKHKLNVEARGTLYMELVKYLTTNIPRVVLVLPGTKAAKILNSL